MYNYKTNSTSTKFSYYCAQNKHRQAESNKCDNPAKQHDRLSMVVFECNGWLHVTVRDGVAEVDITVQHKDDHVPYCIIALPQDVKELITKRHWEPVTQVRRAHA